MIRRIVVAGSVDHGKSTLLGRILLEGGRFPKDRIQAVEKTCAEQGRAFEPAVLLDALKEEQVQGVTIDSTQLRFERDGKRYLLIDAPGHLEFLKNMATSASEAELGLLVVDVQEGVREQTTRHLKMLALLGIGEVVFAVNKLDAVAYDEARFRALAEQLCKAAAAERLVCLDIVPIAALTGENVAAPSERMPWRREPLLSVLANAGRESDPARDLAEPFRMALQDVYRFGEERYYAGRIAAGKIEKGAQILFSPSGKLATIEAIEIWPETDLPFAVKGESVALRLSEPLFVERGEVLSLPAEPPTVETRLTARLAWLSAEPLDPNRPYLIKLGTVQLRGDMLRIREANSVRVPEPKGIANGDFFEADLLCDRPIAFDETQGRDALNRLVLCTEMETVAAGLIAIPKPAKLPKGPLHVTAETGYVARGEREQSHKGAVLWLTGLSGSGKSTLAKTLERKLHAQGIHAVALDGDNLRKGLCADLGFSPEDRSENIRRIAHTARLFLDAGFIVITACISPYADDRELARQIIGPEDFKEIFVFCPLEVCRARDPKGLYAKAASGEVQSFSGTSAPYQPPVQPALRLDTSRLTIDEELTQAESLLFPLPAEAGRGRRREAPTGEGA